MTTEEIFKKWQATGKIILPVNMPEHRSIEELKKTLKGMHYANIYVRKNAQDFNFNADWLSKILPLIETIIK